uniref:Uncharacterized protein n=1 Tax=Oryza punctata TaxID=4537 RepID=A0A0E0JP91_ORYPU
MAIKTSKQRRQRRTMLSRAPIRANTKRLVVIIATRDLAPCGHLGLLGLTVLLLLLQSTSPATTTLRGRFRDHDLDTFSVRITSYEGIDLGRPAATVLPEFRVTLATANGACVDRATVTVRVVLGRGVGLGARGAA